MILKKQTQDGIVSATYSSSNILASSYDTANGNLIITFKTGSRYQYAGVSNSDYVKFEIAESQGVIFNTHIKKYPFEKLSAIDATLLTEEIANLKADQVKILVDDRKEKLVHTMNNLIFLTGPNAMTGGLTQDDVDTMFKDGLEKLQSQIADYFLIPAKITN